MMELIRKLLLQRLLMQQAATLLFHLNLISQMKVMARACGHNNLNKFNQKDSTPWKKEMAEWTGIKFGGLK